MIKTIVILFFTALFIFLLSTCYYDSEEYLFPVIAPLNNMVRESDCDGSGNS